MFSPWRPFKARSMSTDSHALPNLPEERRLRPPAEAIEHLPKIRGGQKKATANPE
jgi:hypothetical protein